jgi:predicted PurR-regulated permease PerM
MNLFSRTEQTPPNETFQTKVWITAAIFSFMVIIFLLIKSTINVFLLVLAGTLIAIFFRALSSRIQGLTKWKEGICVLISIVSTLLIMVSLFWLIGAKVQQQIAELIETLPKAIDNSKAWLNESSVGEKLLGEATSEDSIKKAQVFAGQFFQSTFGILGDLYVILFIGIFLTISPQTYTKGFVQIIPVRGQQKAEQVLDKLEEKLRKWLKGTFLSMFIVFLLTAIGLAILGMPLWLVLALLAGLLCFIPNFGPLLALIPAVLLGLMQSTQMALLVAGLYILIQSVESNFITTAIQKKLTNIPPALILVAQLFLGTLTGALGLVLAIPITLIIMVLVEELYIKKRSNALNPSGQKDAV